LEKINEKKEKIGKLKKKSNFENLFFEKKRKKKRKVSKKKNNTVNYYCNPQCFVCGIGGNNDSPHHLEYVIISKQHIVCWCSF
jgi:uncharacterized FAD-dependent dehydrogenase